MERLSDKYLQCIVNSLDGIGEVPWLIQKEMARELLELRKQYAIAAKEYGELVKISVATEDRLAAAEKVVNSLRGVAGENFIKWIHERIINVYKESQNVDFCHKLRAISDALEVYDKVVKDK